MGGRSGGTPGRYEPASHRAQVWVALGIVYVVWGSTYLGIELAGETIPAVFGAGVRFTIVGLLVCGIVIWRRGLHALKVRRAELASAALIGLLLPGANSILFVTEQKVPIGLTSLIIASVPLWVLLFRLAASELADRVATLGSAVGRRASWCSCAPAAAPGRSATSC